MIFKFFILWVTIAYKESLETKYWLKLLFETNYINEASLTSLFADADELGKILFSILKKHELRNNLIIDHWYLIIVN